jgi:hypothetical protein
LFIEFTNEVAVGSFAPSELFVAVPWNQLKKVLIGELSARSLLPPRAMASDAGDPSVVIEGGGVPQYIASTPSMKKLDEMV